MSVVVDMKMPVQCASCPMWNIVPVKGEMVDICEANQMVLMTPYGNRPTKCPIICELPKNHGDLIDSKTLWNEWQDCHGDYNALEVLYTIDTMPIIVSAETGR